ncbi:MAG: gfo/Idh/MocA family oxidoreductase, partial [Oligoflexia bacterium]|nr:gfo/Idh/MocA family oxidoreductase [Oligoflexia bacterium]
MGEKGTVKIGGIALNKIEHWDFKDYHDDDKSIMNMNNEIPDVYGCGHYGYYVNIFEAMNGMNFKFVDGFEGRKSLEIISAIYLSSAEERKIYL